jgi:hypothetical protein
MNMGPSLEAAICAATQEFHILWNPKVHHHVHN